MRKTTWVLIAVFGAVVYGLSQNSAMLGKTPRHMLKELEDRYRLAPDKRFLLGLQEIQSMFGAARFRFPKAVFHEGRWDVAIGNIPVGSLQELPSFSEGIQLLRRHVQQNLRRLKLKDKGHAWANELADIESRLNSLHPMDLNALLVELNQLWDQGARSAQTLKLAANALARLAYVSFDTIETADQVSAKALCFVVLAQVASGEPLLFEESLLAYRMGYGTHAENLSKQLPANHLWRLYLEKNDKALVKKLDDPSARSDAWYWLMQRLAKEDHKQAWLLMLGRQYNLVRPPIHALVTVYSTTGFEPENMISRIMPHIVMSSLVLEATLPPDGLRIPDWGSTPKVTYTPHLDKKSCLQNYGSC